MNAEEVDVLQDSENEEEQVGEEDVADDEEEERVGDEDAVVDDEDVVDDEGDVDDEDVGDEDVVDDDVDDDDDEADDDASKQNTPPLYSSDDNSDIESESEDGDSFDVRIDNEFKMNFIQSIHPEELHDTVHDMNAACVITRNDDQYIIDDHHQTYPFLTKYERARVLGLRITQLNKGAKPLIEYKSNIIDNHIIAEQELQKKQIPFIVMRPLPNGKKEYWRLQDLEIIDR